MRRDPVTTVSPMSGQDIARRVYGRAAARRWWPVAPALAVVLPLAASIAQQAGRGRRDGGRDDERVEGSGPAQSRFDGPTLPAAALLSDDQRERVEPFLIPNDGGRAWLGCVEYEVGAGDRIALREVGPEGRLVDASAIRLVSSTPAAIVRPAAALDAAGRLNVVWTELVGGHAQLKLARGDAKGFAPPIALTSGWAPGRNAKIVRHSDGKLWIAWEQWRPRAGGANGSPSSSGSFDVVLAPLTEAGLGTPIAVGASPGSDLDPAIASAKDGKLVVAWCRWGGRDYEIALRTFDPANGAPSDEVNVSADAASDDVHPALATTADGAAWLAWDRFEDAARGASTPPELRAEAGSGAAAARRTSPSASVRVACVRLGEKLEVALPKSRGLDGKPAADGLVAGAPLQSFSGGTPRLVAGSDGRVHVVYRFLARQGPGGKAYGYPLLACTIDAEGIGPPVMVADSAGGPEEPALCASGAAILVAWQQDHRLECETGTLLRPIPPAHFEKLVKQGVVVTGSLAPSGIGLARIETAGTGAAAASASRTVRLDPPHFHPCGEALADPLVSGEEHFTIEGGGAQHPVKYRVFWGDLHRHSSVSRCSRGFEPGAVDRWLFGRDVNLCDFMALTDHSCHVDALGWWRLDKICEMAASPDFVALAGFEWSTGFHGHQNVILRGELRPFLSNVHPKLATPAGLYAALNPENALAIPHHPADVTRRVDFKECDPRLVRLVEIYQAQRGSYEFDGAFKQSRQANAVGSFAADALALGLRVGFIASTDHGEGASYACVVAESLDRGHLFDALRARRTYGATTKGMLIDLRVDGHLMGEEINAGASSAAPKVWLHARGATELSEAIVFRNGEPWQVVGRASPDPAGRTELTLQIELAPPKQPRASDWSVTVKAPGVAVKPGFELPVYARDDLGPDHPEWKVAGDVATYSWKRNFAGFWEPIHSRLRLAGARGATVLIEATASDGGAALSRDLTLAELAAGTAIIAGDSPLGAWSCSAKESFDASVDLTKGLGGRELTKEWSDDAPAAGASWYYARVIQVDGEMAWSSPIWIERK